MKFLIHASSYLFFLRKWKTLELRVLNHLICSNLDFGVSTSRRPLLPIFRYGKHATDGRREIREAARKPTLHLRIRGVHLRRGFHLRGDPRNLRGRN